MLCLVARHQIGRLEFEREGLQRHRVIVVEEGFADAKEFTLGGDAPYLVEELAGRFDAHSDVVQVLLHFLHARGFADIGRANGCI